MHSLPMPVNDELENFFTTPAAYTQVDQIVNKTYLQNLNSYEIVSCSKENLNVAQTACFFQIQKIILDSSENISQKLASVYSGAGNVGANIVMLVRGYSSGEIEMFLGVCGEHSRINGAYPKAKVLFDSFRGNFPGCINNNSNLLDMEDTRVLLNKCYDSEYNAVASVSCIASPRNEQDSQNHGFYQGMEKFFETMSGNDYSVVIMAQPINSNEIEAIRKELENLYSQLAPYAKIQLGVNWSTAQSISHALSENFSVNINKSDSATLGIGKTKNISESNGTFEAEQSAVQAEFIVGFSNGISTGGSTTKTKSEGGTVNQIVGEVLSQGAGKSVGETETNGTTDSFGKSIQLQIENKTITETLNKIDAQLKRLQENKGGGIFATATYFLAPSLAQAQMAASSYKAIISGNNTNLETSAINVWTKNNFKEIFSYLQKFRHPIFKLKTFKENDESIITSTPAILSTSSELAISMGLPRNKVNGIPFFESVSFERDIVRVEKIDAQKDLKLGNIYHLGREENNSVFLNSNDLTMHCFITGTTGSGKSNTVYELLFEILDSKKHVKFMVIEPVKGDYKTIFGKRENVKVYGTNNTVTRLLKVNPFRFRREVHVLEHIDYLIGIFNVCWAMEAAMPSILKQAIQRAYENSGWNLRNSQNRFDENLFPNFNDVLESINQIMNESEYSAENKGNYKGALCTRLQDLTTGLNEMIFTSNDLSDEELFEENVIIDLSRLASDETKSLLSGLLLMRLREYRQSTRKKITEKLRHVTVLEEAHNLLKRTSTEQIMHSSNIAGKAVEMISNSMADMRSSGESFIIVDQSPEKVDLSAIRNTNTKIVLRLPETADKEIVGGAMSLNSEQIKELSKLPTGVAAVYQNNWMGAALVKIPEIQIDEEFFFEREDIPPNEVSNLVTAIAQNNLDSWFEVEESQRKRKINALQITGRAKFKLNEYATQDENKHLSEVAFAVFNTEFALNLVVAVADVKILKECLRRELIPSVKDLTQEELDYIIKLLLEAQQARTEKFSKLYQMFVKYLKDNGGERRILRSRQGVLK